MSNGDSMEKYKLKQLNEDIKNLLGTKYDDLFEDVIKSRGVKYSLLNHINSINVKNDIVNAKVKGNDIYNVKIAGSGKYGQLIEFGIGSNEMLKYNERKINVEVI